MGAAARLIDGLAHKHAGGRWLSTGGGGYDVYRVVPRTWSLVWLAATHAAVPAALPDAWRDRWTDDAEHHGQSPIPTTFEDEPNAGVPRTTADDRLDERAIKTAVSVLETALGLLPKA